MKLYHIGFSKSDLGVNAPQTVLLSGLNSYSGNLPDGKPILVATSGMGASSLSIVVNELVQVGIKQFIRIGTCGSIQPQIPVGSIVVSQAALCRQGAALDIAPIECP